MAKTTIFGECTILGGRKRRGIRYVNVLNCGGGLTQGKVAVGELVTAKGAARARIEFSIEWRQNQLRSCLRLGCRACFRLIPGNFWDPKKYFFLLHDSECSTLWKFFGFFLSVNPPQGD